MKANLKKLRKRRVFADEFKQSLVKKFVPVSLIGPGFG